MERVRESASERVVRRVAKAANTDELELPPLYEVTDPDALDAFVAATADGCVSFTYAGYEVTVDSDGAVTITDESAGSSPERAVSDD